MRLLLLAILAFTLALTPAFAQPDADAGQRNYEVCAGCHGFLGEGSEIVGAPRLAGVESWYLERQMGSFRAGHRGYVAGDVNGQRMALMAQAVESDRQLGDLLVWIRSLPVPQGAAETADSRAMAAAAAVADASGGQSLYALCSACHGADAQGNEALGAPALVTLDDWYVAEQLRLYAVGLRGTHPADTYGAQMRALIESFDTDEKRRDLAAYITTLRR